MARKKARSAKQKANDKRLGAMARARGRKSTPKRRKATKTRKTNKPRKRRTTMVKRRRSSRSSSSRGSGIINKIPLLKNKTVQAIGFGLGMGSLAGIIASAIPVPIVQQNASLIKTGVTFATNPLAGVVSLALGGGLGQLSNLFGGGSGGNTNTSNGGFA